MVNEGAQAVVFSAFVVPEEAKDVREHLEQRTVLKACRELVRNFQNAETVGLVYVFIADGYQAILNSTEPAIGLAKERRIRRILQAEIDKIDAKKFQIVGTDELIPTLDRLAQQHGRSLAEVFLGGGKTLFYDSPKIIEAIIRLARWNRPEPILRIDADVEVNDDAVEELIAFHQAQKEAIGLHPVYFFSGGYEVHDRESETQQWLLNDFAARVQHICTQSGAAYKVKEREAESFLRDLAAVGADPFTQVISGAGLCMSYEAISMLPPFANVGDLIVWIDDHLKRKMHEALALWAASHTDLVKGTALARADVNPQWRSSQANFKQCRYPPGCTNVTRDQVNWGRETYLPRIVRGAILDALILERQPGRPDKPGPLATLVAEFLAGKRRKPTKRTLRKHLWTAASGRLDKLCDLWLGKAYTRYGPGARVQDIRRDQERYIEEAINDAHRYFWLLQMWPVFARVVANAPQDPVDNHWLFRDLV